jgi:ferritin-like metal-binding protein YciE
MEKGDREMRLIALKLETLHDLFVEELKLTYDCEKRIIDAMPKMIDAASSGELKQKFSQHLEQTRDQASRLEDAFDMLDMEPQTEKCEGIVGILAEGEDIVGSRGNPDVKDAGLVAAAQKVEHYEIAAYGTLRTFAQTMGHNDIAQKLQITLGEEKDTDKLLTEFAEKSANIRAPQM